MKENAGVLKKTRRKMGVRRITTGLWRRGDLTIFDPAAVAAEALALGLHTAAVMIAPKSEIPSPQTKTATKKQAKYVDASSKKSAIAASAASLVSK
jgi:hypothetical protein